MADVSFKPSRVDKSYPNRRWEEKVGRTLENHLRYSTTEKATGEVWIDGSPIRRIVVSTGTLPNSTTSQTAHGISFTNIIRIYGWATSGGRWLPLPYVDTTTANLAEVSVTATNVEITTATNLSAYTTSYVILEYV